MGRGQKSNNFFLKMRGLTSEGLRLGIDTWGFPWTSGQGVARARPINHPYLKSCRIKPDPEGLSEVCPNIFAEVSHAEVSHAEVIPLVDIKVIKNIFCWFFRWSKSCVRHLQRFTSSRGSMENLWKSWRRNCWSIPQGRDDEIS